MPGNQHWTILANNEEPDAVLDHPWIPANHVIDNIMRAEIPDVDNMYNILATGSNRPYDPRLERFLRPMLFSDMPLTLAPNIDRMLEAAITASMSEPQPSQTHQTHQTHHQRLPQHVIDIVLSAAETNRHICPITMESIRKTTAAVTSCGHVFQKAAIREWLQTHNTCPECRQPCIV
jgi:hypothetical protein